MFGDRIQQKEQVSIGLSCGLCGGAVHPGETHNCDKILNTGESNKELCQQEQQQVGVS